MLKKITLGILALGAASPAYAQDSILQAEPFVPPAATQVAAPTTAPALDAAKPVGPWKTGVIRAKDGQFQYCISEARYANDKVLVLALNPLGQINLGLGEPGGSAQASDNREFTIKIDGRYSRTLPAKVMNPELTVVSAGEDKPFMAAFASGSTLSLIEADHVTSFSLKGTKAAIQQIGECVQVSINGAAGNAEKPAMQAQAPVAAPVAKPAPVEAQAQTQAQTQTEEAPVAAAPVVAAPVSPELAEHDRNAPGIPGAIEVPAANIAAATAAEASIVEEAPLAAAPQAEPAIEVRNSTAVAEAPAAEPAADVVETAAAPVAEPVAAPAPAKPVKKTNFNKKREAAQAPVVASASAPDSERMVEEVAAPAATEAAPAPASEVALQAEPKKDVLTIESLTADVTAQPEATKPEELAQAEVKQPEAAQPTAVQAEAVQPAPTQEVLAQQDTSKLDVPAPTQSAVQTQNLPEVTLPPAESEAPAAAPRLMPLPAQLKLLLAGAGLKDAAPLATNQLSLPADFAWSSGKLLGGVKETVVPAGSQMMDVLAPRLSEISSSCEGKPSIKMGKLEKTGALQIQPVRMTCDVNGQSEVTSLLYVLSRDGVMSSIFHQGGAKELKGLLKATNGFAKSIKDTQG